MSFSLAFWGSLGNYQVSSEKRNSPTSPAIRSSGAQRRIPLRRPSKTRRGRAPVDLCPLLQSNMEARKRQRKNKSGDFAQNFEAALQPPLRCIRWWGRCIGLGFPNGVGNKGVCNSSIEPCLLNRPLVADPLCEPCVFVKNASWKNYPRSPISNIL